MFDCMSRNLTVTLLYVASLGSSVETILLHMAGSHLQPPKPFQFKSPDVWLHGHAILPPEPSQFKIPDGWCGPN